MNVKNEKRKSLLTCCYTRSYITSYVCILPNIKLKKCNFKLWYISCTQRAPRPRTGVFNLHFVLAWCQVTATDTVLIQLSSAEILRRDWAKIHYGIYIIIYSTVYYERLCKPKVVLVVQKTCAQAFNFLCFAQT